MNQQWILALALDNWLKDYGNLYRQFIAACAICYTDFWYAYEQILPSTRHKAVGKDSGKTSYIERFNNTLRQRVGRLVGKTLSFSKIIDTTF